FLVSVDAIERMRVSVAADEFKATFLRDKVRVYEDAIKACLDAGGRTLVLKAFTLVESSKSRALAELLSRYARSSANLASTGKATANSRIRVRLHKLIEDMNWYSSQASRDDDIGARGVQASHYRTAMLRRERQIAALFRRLEGEALELTGMQAT